MSKLESYITEARNIKSEEAKIKKLVNGFMIDTDKRKTIVLRSVKDIMISVSGSLDIPGFEKFTEDLWQKLAKIDSSIGEDVNKMGIKILERMEYPQRKV